MDIYKKINPIEHTITKQGVETYKVEPYVIEADIYSEGKFAGRGGWTWYTGSSSWLYEAQIRYILGINIYHGNMTIKPSAPEDWKKFDVTLKWKNATYNIEFRKTGEYSITSKNKNLKITNTNDDTLNQETIQSVVLNDEGDYEISVTF